MILTRAWRIAATATPSAVPPTAPRTAKAVVSASPCSRKRPLLRITSGIGEPRVKRGAMRARKEQHEPARRRHQRQIEKRHGDVNLEAAEGLALDRARRKGELAHRDDRGE